MYSGSTNHLSLLKITLGFGYYTCFSPFKLKFSVQGGKHHHLTTYRPQEIICGIGQVLGNLVLLTEALKHLAKVKVLKTPVTYFNAFYGMTNILMSLSVSWWLWRKQKIVQKIADKTLTANTDPKIKKYLLAFTIIYCVIASTLSFTSTIFGVLIFPSHLYTPSFWWDRLIIASRSRLLGYDNVEFDSEFDSGTVPIFHKVIAIIFCIGYMFRFINRFFLELLLLTGILCFWTMTNSFAKVITNSPNLHWNDFKKNYKNLKNFSKCFNEAFGGIVFIYAWNALLMYSTRLDTLFTSKDEFFRWRGVYFYTATVLIFTIAADCCRQANSVTKWLAENHTRVPSDHALATIMNDVSNNFISVSGLGVFSITYSFVANMTGLVVTYFLICSQN